MPFKNYQKRLEWQRQYSKDHAKEIDEYHKEYYKDHAKEKLW